MSSSGYEGTRARYQWTCGAIYQVREVRTKGLDVFYSICMECLEQENPKRQQVALRLWGAESGEGRRASLKFLGRCDLKVLELDSAYSYVAVNTL